PITIRHTVSGVERNNPTGPQSQVQKTAAATSATFETPVLCPYSHGSIRLLLISSTTTNKPPVRNNFVQPGSAAIASVTGNEAATHGPTYGMNRNNIASSPHNNAFGTPMKYSPIAIGSPYVAFTSRFIKRY